MTNAPVVLAPIRRHPELAAFEEGRLHVFADVLGIDLIRDWDGALSTSITDAWRIRQHLDEERLRQAQASEIALARAELDQAALLGPLRRKIERSERATAAHAAIDSEIPFQDERTRDWEKRADEKGAALFGQPAPSPVTDTRTPIERLRDKRS